MDLRHGPKYVYAYSDWKKRSGGVHFVVKSRAFNIDLCYQCLSKKFSTQYFDFSALVSLDYLKHIY